MYLLDTDHINILQRRTEPAYSKLKKRLHGVPRLELFVSIISFHEGFAGWNAFLNKSRTPADLVLAYKRMTQLIKDFAAANVAPYDDAAAQMAAELRSSGVRIATMDLRIAAIALVNKWMVITRNTVDFSRVPGLRIDDWCQ